MVKLRLNISAVAGENIHGKFLLLIEPLQSRRDLIERIQKELRGGGINCKVHRLLNKAGSILPDESVEDMLRDNDEVIAELEGDGTQMFLASKSYVGKDKEFADLNRGLVRGEERNSQKLVTGSPLDTMMENAYGIEEGLMMENMSPKLREFVMSRFEDAYIQEPHYQPEMEKFCGARYYQATGPFVAVYMTPHNSGHGERSSMPIEYNIAKEDLIEFQRLVETNIDQIQIHIEHLHATLSALKALLDKGLAPTDATNVMLPYKYQTWDQVDGVLIEAERPMIPDMECECPCIIVDACGLRERLPYVKASLKRTTYQHLSQMEGFQLIHAVSGGPQCFGHTIANSTTQNLQAADEWLDKIQHRVPGTSNPYRLQESLRLALSFPEVDEIWVVSGAVGLSDVTQNTAMLQAVKAWNVRRVRIHTVAIDADSVGELLLRNLAVSNLGKFTMKRFDGSRYRGEDKCSNWRSSKLNLKWSRLLEDFSKQRLTVGGQVKIIEIMQAEERQGEAFWKEEWKCANRLLTRTKPKKVPNQEELREMQKKLSKSVFSVRVGGGYVYNGDQQETEMDQIFDVLPKSDTARSKPRQVYPLPAPWDSKVTQAREIKYSGQANKLNRSRADRAHVVPRAPVKNPSPPKVPVKFERRWSF